MPELSDSEATPVAQAGEAPVSFADDAPAAEASADEAPAADAPAEVSASDAEAPAADADEAPVAPAADLPVAEADEVLLASVDLARRALLEVTPPETVGGVLGHLVEGEHLLTLLFAADMGGYPGWHWSVTLVRVDDAEPTVLETELMPGDAALLAPEWVPWSERLADYRAAQEAIAAAAAEAGEPIAGDELDEGAAEFLDDDLDDDDDD